MDVPRRTGEKLPKGMFIRDGAYWLLYYVNGVRHRERVGPDKRLAEKVLHKRRAEIAEGKFLDRQRPVTTTFDEMAQHYLAYVRDHKRSWERDVRSVKPLTTVFTGKRVAEITPAAIERYKTLRLTSISRHGRHLRPATVNRELACLKHMFNVARKGLVPLAGGRPAENPVSAIRFLDEQNIRAAILILKLWLDREPPRSPAPGA